VSVERIGVADGGGTVASRAGFRAKVPSGVGDGSVVAELAVAGVSLLIMAPVAHPAMAAAEMSRTERGVMEWDDAGGEGESVKEGRCANGTKKGHAVRSCDIPCFLEAR
jgi:hypothetical protein